MSGDLNTTLDLLTLTFNNNVDSFDPDGSGSMNVVASDGSLDWITDGGYTILGNTVLLTGSVVSGSTGTVGNLVISGSPNAQSGTLTDWNPGPGIVINAVTIHG